MDKIVLLDKTYDGESIVDVSRDAWEAFDFNFTPQAKDIPTDPCGIQEGTFRVQITWTPNQEPQA